MPIKTRRWNDLPAPDEGFRLLVTRYRPRGVAKADERWDAWDPKLGPSRALHGAVYAEDASPLPWPVYRRRYIQEQRENADRIAALAERVKAGETITLLCSSACTRESRCHRSLLKELIGQAIQGGSGAAVTGDQTPAEPAS